MTDMQVSTGTTMRLSEAARDHVAAGIWLTMLTSAIFLIAHGQSVLMAAGLMLELTAAYSTFVLCGKANRNPIVHVIPYAFALSGIAFLCLAPDFPNPLQAGLVFLGVTALMHGSVVYSTTKDLAETEDSAYAGAT